MNVQKEERAEDIGCFDNDASTSIFKSVFFFVGKNFKNVQTVYVLKFIMFRK